MKLHSWPDTRTDSVSVPCLRLGGNYPAYLAVARAPTRDSFFIGFEFGVGSIGSSVDSDREIGRAGHFKIGGAVTPRVLLGAESAGWAKSGGGSAGHLNLTAFFYPSSDDEGARINTLQIVLGANWY